MRPLSEIINMNKLYKNQSILFLKKTPDYKDERSSDMFNAKSLLKVDLSLKNDKAENIYYKLER